MSSMYLSLISHQRFDSIDDIKLMRSHNSKVNQQVCDLSKSKKLEKLSAAVIKYAKCLMALSLCDWKSFGCACSASDYHCKSRISVSDVV